MAHKTLIGGTAYEITGGKTLVNGTAYSIDKGKTLVGGTAYEVAFGPKLNVLYDFGALTTKAAFGRQRCEVLYDNLPFDPSKCNAFMVDGVVYNAEHSVANDSYFKLQYLTIPGGEINLETAEYPFAFSFRQTVSTGKWTVWIYCYEAGTYDFAIGTV